MVAVIHNTDREHAGACRGVTKEFGSGDTRTLALRGVDLDIAYGETTLLVGPSGCGKTTLISIIAGLLNPTDGDVSVWAATWRARRGAALVNFREREHRLRVSAVQPAAGADGGRERGGAAGDRRLNTATKAVRAAKDLLAGGMGWSRDERLSVAAFRRPAAARGDCAGLDSSAATDGLRRADRGARRADGPDRDGATQRVAVQPDRAVIIVTHDSRVYGFGDRIVHMSDGRIERVEEAVAA